MLNLEIVATREEFIASAHKFIGVKWVHQGRQPKEALDCIGILGAAAMDCGISNAPPPTGYPRLPDGTLLPRIKDYGLEWKPPAEREIADILVFSMFGLPWHTGILVERDPDVIIHAHFDRSKVVKERLDSVQLTLGLMTGVYEVPGLM